MSKKSNERKVLTLRMKTELVSKLDTYLDTLDTEVSRNQFIVEAVSKELKRVSKK